MRDLRKAVDEYRRRFLRGNRDGLFYSSDFEQILDMCEGYSCKGWVTMSSLFDAMQYGLEAGFMIGYRKAVRDGRKRKGAAA